jgi:hypothetical protein
MSIALFGKIKIASIGWNRSRLPTNQLVKMSNIKIIPVTQLERVRRGRAGVYSVSDLREVYMNGEDGKKLYHYLRTANLSHIVKRSKFPSHWKTDSKGKKSLEYGPSVSPHYLELLIEAMGKILERDELKRQQKESRDKDDAHYIPDPLLEEKVILTRELELKKISDRLDKADQMEREKEAKRLKALTRKEELELLRFEKSLRK